MEQTEPQFKQKIKIKRQPNEKRCYSTKIKHTLSLPHCCPVSQNPMSGSTVSISYIPNNYILEVASLKNYIESFVGGKDDVRSMEGMIQTIAKECSNVVNVNVTVTAKLILAPSQKEKVKCLAVK